MKKIIKILFIMIFIIFIFISGFILILRNSEFVKIQVDISGLKDISEIVLKSSHSDTKVELEKYISTFNILPDCQCDNEIKVTPLEKWLIKDKELTQEKLEFRSCDKKDKAIFYLYRKGKLDAQKVILWIPGFGVSNFAFYFIKKFFIDELNNGYAILFYNLPYHLDRIPKGKKMGEGLLNLKITDNFKVIKSSICEINTAVNYLKKKNIKSISGWGGSIGGTILWLSSNHIKYEHLALMIPITNWNTVIFNKYLNHILVKVNSNGVNNKLIKNSYNKLSPYFYKSKTEAKNIFLMYSKYDQLTPEKEMLNFANKFNITNIKYYEESHATILLESKVYDDYRTFLEKLD